MSAGSRALLVALCSFQQLLGAVALGRPSLPPPPPRNVTLLSKDFGVFVTWLPGEGSPPGVLYSVRYRNPATQEKGRQVRHCNNISHTTCNLTCGPDPYNKFRARVKALAAGRHSAWVESGSLEYHLDVHLAPPALAVSVAETTLAVSAAFPLASCVRSVFIGLKYELDFWKAGAAAGGKRPFYDRMKWDNVTISTETLSGNYCLSARTSYQVIQPKHSQFSQPLCMLLTPRAKDWKFLIPTAVPFLILLFFCSVVASILHLWKQAAKKAKWPQALDFSSVWAPGMVLEEFVKTDLIYVEQPASGGRWRNEASVAARNEASVAARNEASLVARNEASRAASLLSLSEEEDEDSGSFSSYTEMPRFLKRAPSCPGASVGQEGSPAGSDMGSSHLTGAPVPDLAGLGFSGLVWRGRWAEEDISGFQGSEESSLSESCFLGGLSVSEAGCCGDKWQGWEADTGQADPFLQVSVWVQGLTEGPPAKQQGPYGTDPQWHPRPDPSACLAKGLSQTASSFSLEGQLVCVQTVKLALDEGVVSDSESQAGGAGRDPSPLSWAQSETGSAEAWGKGGSLQPERDPAGRFWGRQHVWYMPRA